MDLLEAASKPEAAPRRGNVLISDRGDSGTLQADLAVVRMFLVFLWRRLDGSRSTT